MSEIKLQSDIAREISVRHPNLRGQFFHVSNERKSQNQAFQARSIGIFPGVSDFLFIKKYNVRGYQIENCCQILGIEVKEPGSFHKKEHIEQQYEWGSILENCGGRYFVVRSVLDCVQVIEGNYENVLCLQDLKKIINECKGKNIKF